MIFVQVLFWGCLTVLFYCYIGYGLLLFVRNKIKSSFSSLQEAAFELMPVTIIVAAYNEKPVLVQKIENCFQIDYPRHLLHIIFITDGSIDGSPELVSQYDSITLLHQPERKGKPAALKRAMQFVQTPVVVFSDANTMLNANCIRAMVRHYANEKVGGVAGEKKILREDHSSPVAEAEGLYWRYESFMKRQDADFNTVVGAAGELFSIRSELFHPLEDELILDDFIFSIHVCLKGYKIEYEPAAYATEIASLTLADEEKRKTRIAAGAFQSVFYLKNRIHVFQQPRLSLQYFSRRWLRWIACPLLILLILVTNVDLAANYPGHLFEYLLWAQGCFYLSALLGRILLSAGYRIGAFNIPFYFLFMNVCLVKGFFNYLLGRQTVLWEKSMRKAME